MQNPFKSQTFTTALAIFSMFFGAGNLFYPVLVGITAGSCGMFGLMGFITTAVLLPLIGLVSMVLFDGDYEVFFERLGVIPGKLFIAACMIIIGPLIAIPRIVTLSYEMIEPFFPFYVPGIIFALVFMGVTFLCTYRESRVVDALGTVISPLLLASLAVIIVRGFFTTNTVVESATTPVCSFFENLVVGYETLDLLGAIFFASIVITILKKTVATGDNNVHRLAIFTLKAGLIGTALLALVYIGLGMLGMYHGHDVLGKFTSGAMFREVSLRVLGSSGQIAIIVAVVMACLSTAIALFAVIGEYIQHEVCKNKITFPQALLILLVLCLPLSTFGLDTVRAITGGPLLYVGYPVLIMLTLLNTMYKLFGFKPVKIPVLVTGIIALAMYLR